ncbi:MAG: cation transporter [Clostridia bacterium]|nr:cation transporter [Clostridia bacterium]
MKKVYRLENLDCAHCASKMEQAIAKLEGVESVSVSFLTQKLILKAEEEQIESIMDQAVQICKKIEPDCVIRR